MTLHRWLFVALGGGLGFLTFWLGLELLRRRWRARLAPTHSPSPQPFATRMQNDKHDPEADAVRARHAAAVAAIRQGIQTGLCPRCNQPAFTGSEVFEHSVSFSGGGGGQVYDVSGRCTACGHIPREKDLR